ncbi:hypothetical protein N6H14_01215 [Paenibacillus sp. CC-CFT747]|nr:hypothetical protein N6H14_01215 [Paenibacillus sp. CC-CFT747]
MEFAEHSGQFRVYGKMSVVLCSSNLDEVSDHLFQKCSYRIPGSLYADKTVWALSSGQQPLILQVHSQTAEWGAPVREDVPALVPIAQ